MSKITERYSVYSGAATVDGERVPCVLAVEDAEHGDERDCGVIFNIAGDIGDVEWEDLDTFDFVRYYVTVESFVADDGRSYEAIVGEIY